MMPTLRLAQFNDIPELETLIACSGRTLSAGFYTPAQAEAITRHVFGVDTQLIRDQTYFAIEAENKIVACGGWSKRQTLFGADRTKQEADPVLDPKQDAARIRAFFVMPHMARRGLGTQLMNHCITSAQYAGFQRLALASTLPGIPLYQKSGFTLLKYFELALPGDISVALAHMEKPI